MLACFSDKETSWLQATVKYVLGNFSDKQAYSLQATVKYVALVVLVLLFCSRTASTILCYVREQTNHHINTLNSILLTINSNLKAFRGALFTFKSNLLSSLGPMAQGFLPISLVPPSVLYPILHEVATREMETGTRLTLAIPFKNILTYYETALLTQVTTSEVGLQCTLSIPFASRETILNVFHAIPIPMPTRGSSKATIWDIEADFIAVTENKAETALLTQEDLLACVGSKAYSICEQGFAMEKKRYSCLASLLFNHGSTAVQKCSVKPYLLPQREKALNLGFGRWLILSAHGDFTLTESNSNSSHPLQVAYHNGCQACVFTLNCGRELEGPNIHVRSDLSACRDVPALRIDVQLPDPIAHLFTKLPTLEDMPHIPTIEAARFHLIEDVEIALATVPESKRKNLEELDKIADPIIFRMTQLRPNLQSKFDDAVDFKLYITVAVLSFCFSILFHVLLGYLQLKLIRVHKKFPFRLTLKGKKIKTLP